MILFGIFGAAIFGIIVDRTKRFLLIYKLCIAGTALSAVSLAVSFNRENAEIHVALSVLAFGFFGFPTYPLGLELAVESTYPTPEATSSGSLICMG
jgi:predicted MFS family arabinose efflux permease